MRVTVDELPPGLIVQFPVTRTRGHERLKVPFDLYWRPSRVVVGGLLTVHPKGEGPTQYLLCEVVCDAGRIWTLQRRDTGERHDVRREALRYSCDCRGYQRNGYCRHTDAVAFLDSEGFFEIRNGLYLSV